jgi:aldehyde:ferredoxin oxidoreductase
MFGYHGKVLLVDLTTQRTMWEPLEEQILRHFIGGIGLGTYLLYTYCPPGVEPFDPANPLIFVGSPLVGTHLTTSSKFAVLTKSPLTGCIGDSLSSSFMATEIKKTGCDALILTGRSPFPCLLAINDGAVEFLDATPYLGLSTTAPEHEIKGNCSGCENLTLAIASPHGGLFRHGTPAWLIP